MFDPLLIGHREVRQRLLDRIQAGRIGGSWLFTGPEGIGKRRVAMELAQRELCFRGDACGQCEGCRMFKGELPVELPNFLRIAPEGKAGLIRIGAIREDDLVEGGVISWAHRAPPPRCHRWIMVEDAHRLNGASANMLLKILEEPPAGTHFLLITHRPEAMLQTIRSRCERIPFLPLGAAEAWAVARRAGWEDPQRPAWTALAAGTLRYLEPEAFQRASDQLDAWLELAFGASFQDSAGPLLPEKNATVAQSEQVGQCLELLLLILADVTRQREGKVPRLEPWAEQVARLGSTGLAVAEPQGLVFEALRNLGRNPSAESLLREISMGLRAS